MVAAMSANKHTRSNKAPHGHARLGIDPLGRLAGTRRAKGAAKPKVVKPDAKKDELPKFPIASRLMPWYQVEGYLQDAYSKGYELLVPPVYGGDRATPRDTMMDGAAARKTPYFLVTVIKKSQTPAAS